MQDEPRAHSTSYRNRNLQPGQDRPHDYSSPFLDILTGLVTAVACAAWVLVAVLWVG